MRRFKLLFTVLALAGTLLFGACNALQKPDDKAITSDVLAKLYQDPVLKTRDIHVVSEKGVVVLTGTVGTESEKAEVERLANQASGVKQVIDQLALSTAVATPTPAPEPAVEPAPTAKATPVRPARRARTYNTSHTSAAAEPAPAQTVAAPKPAEAYTAQSSAPPPPRQPERITISSGTVITVRLIDGIDSSRNHAGDEFAASVEAPVVVGDRVVIPRNSDARVRLVESRSAGHMTGRSELELELAKVSVGNNAYNVETGFFKEEGASRGKRTAETVGGGAALGALIGAVAGKGKGAAIGAAIGAGAGTAAQAATHGQQVRVPSETKLDFTVKTPLTVTL